MPQATQFLDLFEESVVDFADFFQAQVFDSWTMFHKGCDAVNIETGALGDEEPFEIRVCREELLPRRRTDKERSQKLDTLENIERGTEHVECSVIKVTTEIEAKRSNISIVICKCFQSRRRKIYTLQSDSKRAMYH